MTRRHLIIALEIIVPASLFAIWWSWSALAPSLYFPDMSKILSAFRQEWLFSRIGDVASSLENLALGLLIAAGLGITLGTLLGLTPALRRAMFPVVEFYRSVPGPAVLPIAVVFFGIAHEMRISVIAFGTLWPILLNTIDGVGGIDPLAHDVARSYRLPWRVRLTSVVLPAAAAQIMTGLSVALSLGVSVMVFSELIGTPHGIGSAILTYEQGFDIPQMWSGMILLGILGYALNLAFRSVEYRVLFWHRGMRATVNR